MTDPGCWASLTFDRSNLGDLGDPIHHERRPGHEQAGGYARPEETQILVSGCEPSQPGTVPFTEIKKHLISFELSGEAGKPHKAM